MVLILIQDIKTLKIVISIVHLAVTINQVKINKENSNSPLGYLMWKSDILVVEIIQVTAKVESCNL